MNHRANDGIRRDEAGLSHAREQVEKIAPGVRKYPGKVGQYEAVELRSATRVAGIILTGALKRMESRDLHFREGHPDQNDSQWLGHFRVRRTNNGDVWDFAAPRS